LRAAVVDGRLRNTLYRLEQLQKLHKVLAQDADSIQTAIQNDSGCTAAEARIEYSLALNSLRSRHQELDADKALHDEYLVTNNHSAEHLRNGVGIVIIRAASHTQFFSIVAPLSGALAAGNCIILELERNTRTVPETLKKALEKALDKDIFAIVAEAVRDEKILASSVQVLQDIPGTTPRRDNQIVSLAAPTIAVVDRSADFEATAKALVAARFSFNGRSPFAPDLVLVNEFVKKDLVDALIRHRVTLVEPGDVQRSASSRSKSFLSAIQNNHDAHLVTSDTRGAIVDVGARSEALLHTKVAEPCLVIHSVKSLDDAIDFVNASKRISLAAAYYFGHASMAKYLCQFIDSQVSYVNHIPSELFVGPTFPIGQDIETGIRYPSKLFSIPSPAFAPPPPGSSDL
ncbi:ALDH-like protein, partial [Myriangium duriaei CBS 260.36]